MTNFNQPENNASLSAGKQMATDRLFLLRPTAQLTSLAHEILREARDTI